MSRHGGSPGGRLSEGGTNVTSDVPRSLGRVPERAAGSPAAGARGQAAVCCAKLPAKCVGGGGA